MVCLQEALLTLQAEAVIAVELDVGKAMVYTCPLRAPSAAYTRSLHCSWWLCHRENLYCQECVLFQPPHGVAADTLRFMQGTAESVPVTYS